MRETNHERTDEEKLDWRKEDLALSIKRRRKRMAQKGSNTLGRKKMSKENGSVFTKVFLCGAITRFRRGATVC